MAGHKPHLLPEIAEDVAAGLTRSPKSLPPKLFYDEAGSALFEQITKLPEYYLTRCEAAILERHADDICAAAGESVSLVELGAGSARKTRTLLAALAQKQKQVRFVPVDISPAALAAAQQQIARRWRRVRVSPVVADYLSDLSFVRRVPRPRLVLYLGSSIGNFEPMAATALLARLRSALASGDALLLGTDMRKKRALLLRAYDDSRGVTAAFNKNMLVRINRELIADFDPGGFRHVALWNAGMSRMEMYLESLRRQAATIRAIALKVRFEKGEHIHTEYSYKYSQPMVEAMLANAGFTLERTWCDGRGWFCDHLARL